MTMTALGAGLVGLAGNFVLSLGMVLQKKNVAWFGAKDRARGELRREASGWIAGFCLMNVVRRLPVTSRCMGLAANIVGAALIGSDVVAFTDRPREALILKESIREDGSLVLDGPALRRPSSLPRASSAAQRLHRQGR